jgi:catechol-2,3-dioxygenase
MMAPETGSYGVPPPSYRLPDATHVGVVRLQVSDLERSLFFYKQVVIDSGLGIPWEGMPAGATIGHVHLHVGRLEHAEAFYHAALGLAKTVWSYPGALFLAAGGYHHHIGTNTWATGPSASDLEARLLDWELVVPHAQDVADAANSLRAAGYAADHVRDTCWTTDPWGTSLRIVVPHPPKLEFTRVNA